MAATRHRINPSSKVNNDTGFGNSPNTVGGRFIDRDGSFNLRRIGRPFWNRFSIFHTMLNLPLWKFISVIVIFYICINLLYTAVYFFIGEDQLAGIVATTAWGRLKEVYFFSTETFTTVGYGRVNPVGDIANFVASIESLSGFLSLALATGLIYGRFARPKAYLAFSDFAVIAPYKDKTALMFRFVSYKDNHTLTDVEIKTTIALLVHDGDNVEYKFYDLPLERSRVDQLPMNWTVVHAIDENSPLVGFTQEDMASSDVEVYVLVRGFNDIYSSYVLTRTSYTFKEIQFNKKFIPMYRESADGQTTILELHKLNETTVVADGMPLVAQKL